MVGREILGLILPIGLLRGISAHPAALGNPELALKSRHSRERYMTVTLTHTLRLSPDAPAFPVTSSAAGDGR